MRPLASLSFDPVPLEPGDRLFPAHFRALGLAGSDLGDQQVDELDGQRLGPGYRLAPVRNNAASDAGPEHRFVHLQLIAENVNHMLLP